jgi:hypothetical protein
MRGAAVIRYLTERQVQPPVRPSTGSLFMIVFIPKAQ